MPSLCSEPFVDLHTAHTPVTRMSTRVHEHMFTRMSMHTEDKALRGGLRAGRTKKKERKKRNELCRAAARTDTVRGSKNSSDGSGKIAAIGSVAMAASAPRRFQTFLGICVPINSDEGPHPPWHIRAPPLQIFGGRCFADISQIFSDVLQIFCRCSADILQFFCSFFLQIFCRCSTDFADILQMFCRHFRVCIGGCGLLGSAVQ